MGEQVRSRCLGMYVGIRDVAAAAQQTETEREGAPPGGN